MTTLTYRSFVGVEDLALGECTIHSCGDGTSRWWNLWFFVARETDSQPEAFCVAVAPGGAYGEVNGRKTWGLTQSGPGTWQIAPSINVLDTRETHPGEHETVGSLWHQTPAITVVPDGERWAAPGAQP